MKSKDPIIFINHILEAIRDIESFTNNVPKEKFMINKEKQNAVIRSLEIIGEAVKNLPNEFINKYSYINWSEIARTRDKMIHHYFGVDLKIVWDIIKKDIPKLKNGIIEILEKENNSKLLT